jgi:hypothetical protein
LSRRAREVVSDIVKPSKRIRGREKLEGGERERNLAEEERGENGEGKKRRQQQLHAAVNRFCLLDVYFLPFFHGISTEIFPCLFMTS